ncbi:MAG: carboxypeptidase regulatory-like domain-containing protein [Caldilineaceae bacterium]|nr:carboxypeptidase regulatory-like domain-containing protein [Caldilineaceae bacterium]
MRATRFVAVRVCVLFFVFLLFTLGFGIPLEFGYFSVPTVLHAEENQPEAPGSVSGVVRNAEGEPVAGILVTLYYAFLPDNVWYPFAQVTTDELGRYRFGLLGAGTYRLGFFDPEQRYAQHYYPAASDLYDATPLAINGEERTGFDAVLASGGAITGTVRLHNGQVAYKDISLYQKVKPILNPDGNFTEWLFVGVNSLPPQQEEFQFQGLATDEYRICANTYAEDRYVYECYDDVAELNQGTSISVTAGSVVSNVMMVLLDGANLGTIGGRVTTAAGEPLPGIDVYVTTQSLLPAARSALAAPQNFGQSPLTAPQPVNALAQPFGDATAAVTPPSVPAFPYSYRSSTDKNGRYTIDTLLPGTYQLFFHDSSGRYRYEFYDDVTFRTNSNVVTVHHREVLTDVNAALALGAQITGSVTLMGQPASNAQLTLHKWENSQWWPVAFTSVNAFTGAYRFGGLPAGRYRVEASAFVAYPPFSTYYFYGLYGGETWDSATDIRLTTEATASQIDVTLGNGPLFDGAVSGRVTANGKPLANVQVSLQLPFICCYPGTLTFPQTYAVTDAAGRYRIEGLTSALYLVRFDDRNGRYASLFYPGQPLPGYEQMVVISDTGTTTGIDIDLPIGGRIQGHLYERDGSGVENVPVMALLQTTESPFFVFREVLSAADGSYQLQGLSPGTYRVCAGSRQAIIYGYGRIECHGDSRTSPWYNLGQPISVTAGITIDEVGILWGPEREQYLPLIAR